MRHRQRRTKLARKTSERSALFMNMAKSLFIHQQIRTTLAKAKEARKYIEKLITLAKVDSVHHRRLADSLLRDKTLVKLLFTKIAPLFKERNGGYTRIYQLGRRQGDGAQMAVLELVEKRIIEQPVKKQKPVKAKPVGETPKKEQPKHKKEEREKDQGEIAEIIEEKKEAPKDKQDLKKKKVEEKKNWLNSFKGIFGKQTDKEKKKD